jgi:hypothetical protein
MRVVVDSVLLVIPPLRENGAVLEKFPLESPAFTRYEDWDSTGLHCEY